MRRRPSPFTRLLRLLGDAGELVPEANERVGRGEHHHLVIELLEEKARRGARLVTARCERAAARDRARGEARGALVGFGDLDQRRQDLRPRRGAPIARRERRPARRRRRANRRLEHALALCRLRGAERLRERGLHGIRALVGDAEQAILRDLATKHRQREDRAPELLRVLRRRSAGLVRARERLRRRLRDARDLARHVEALVIGRGRALGERFVTSKDVVGEQ